MPTNVFGKKVKEIRLEREVGLRELARKAKIDHTRLSKIEHGKRPAPGLKHIILIAQVLGTDPIELARLAGVPDYFLEIKKERITENVLQGRIVNFSNKLFVIQVGECELEIVADKSKCKEKKVKVKIRPEEITLYKRPESLEGTSARNRFSGTIVEINPYKNYNYVLFECSGFRLKVAVTDKSIHRMGLKPGAEVFATFKATAASLSAN